VSRTLLAASQLLLSLSILFLLSFPLIPTMLFPLNELAILALATTAYAHNGGDSCNENTKPMQIRLAYAGSHGMSVSWNTNQQLKEPTVSWGSSHGRLSKSASSKTSITYQSSSTWNNHVTINGLNPDTKYYYMPMCGNQTYSFTTSRKAGSKDPYKFAMVGDMGTFGPDGLSTTVGKGAANPLQPGDKTTIQSLSSLQSTYDFIWHGLSPFLPRFD
jgi:hypothetical protein